MRLFTLAVLAIFSIPIFGQNICGYNRYLEEVFPDVNVESDIKYASADPYGIVNNQNLALDIYTPKNDTLKKRPLILHAFGGGFLIGWKSEPDIPNWGTQYAKRGFVFVSIDYRLGFNALDQGSTIRAAYRATQDMRSALRFLADSAAVYGIDMDNVFLTGSSAGCFAALIQTFMNEADRPAATYGTVLEPQDLSCFNCTGNNNYNNEEVKVHGVINNWGAILDTSYINLQNDPADNVPVISFHGTEDLIVPFGIGNPFNLPVFPVVAGSAPIHHKLNEQGIFNELHPLVGLGHEPELINSWVTDTIVSKASVFLHKIMRPELDSIIGRNKACIGRIENYNVPFSANQQYCWELSGGNIVHSQGNNIDIEWQTPGIGTLKLTVYNEIQAKTILTKEVEIGTAPIAAFTKSSSNGLFQFAALDSNASVFSWDFGDSTFANGQFTQHQYADTGIFVLELSTQNYYCSSNSIDSILSDICPKAAFSALADDSSAVIVNSSLHGSTAHWDFGNGTSYTGFQPNPTYTENGVYTIQLIMHNAFCSDTTYENLDILHCPIASFELESNGLNVKLENTSSNNFFNNWNFGNTQYSRAENPSVQFDSAGIYEIELIVFNQRACSDTFLKTIYVEENTIVPIDSNTLSIDKLAAIQLNIYPNPVHNILFIETGLSGKRNASIRIWDMLGQIVYTGTKIPSLLQVEDFTNGIYFLQIETKAGIAVRKFVKN